MFVAEVMNKNVKTARPDMTVKEAAKIMNEFRIGSLLVIDGTGSLVGIITERDILSGVVAAGKNSEGMKVDDVMTKEMVTVPPNITLEEAANIMVKSSVKKLPVLQEGEVVGIITATDLITYESKLVEKVSELLQMKKDAGVSG